MTVIGLAFALAAASLAACSHNSTSAPILGLRWAPSQQGYGEVKPLSIFNGGDPTGRVTNIRWRSWGASKAVGSGTGWYVGQNQSVAGGQLEPATIVAWNRGLCRGRLAYQAIEWYFPRQGQSFDPTTYINICTGTYVGLSSTPSIVGSGSIAGGGRTSTPACRGPQLVDRLMGAPSADRQYQLTLDFKNIGSGSCTMEGFPGFVLVGPISDGSSTFSPIHQVVIPRLVVVGPGQWAHAVFTALPGPDICDDGIAWSPTNVRVTAPNDIASQILAFGSAAVDNCQNEAAHPGTYIGPVQPGP